MTVNQRNFRVRNGLTIDGATSGSTSFANPTTGSDLSYVLPGTAGAANAVLTNDGSGNLSWALPGGGGSTFGNVTVGVLTDNSISTTTGDLTITSANGQAGPLNINNYLYSTSTGVVPNTFIKNSTVTNNGVGVLNLWARSTGTPAVGFGPSLQATAELANGDEMGVGSIDWVATDMTANAEDFQVQISATRNGATPDYKVYIDSEGNVSADGDLTLNVDQTAASAVINAYSSTTLGTQTWDGTNWTLSNGVISPGGTLGNVTVGYPTDQTISTTSGNLILDAGSSAYVSIENSNTAQPTYITRTSANTTSSARNLTLLSSTSATPGIGLGGSLEWQVQTAASNTERAAYINVSATDVTSTSEDFRMDFGLMRNGATYANKLSLYSNGDMDMSNGGKFAIRGATSGYTQIGAPATGSNITYTLPGADGTSGYVLSTDGAGTLSWIAAGGAGTTYTIDATTTTGGANFNLTGSDASVDTIKFAGSGSTTVTRTDANTITISSTGGGGGALPMPPSSSMASNPWSLCPGNLFVTNLGANITATAQSVVYTPFYVSAPITLSEVALFVGTATTLASCNAMIYISEVDISSSTGWQPTANLSGGYLGEITNITTTGIKSITGLSTVLPAGAYLMVVQFSNFTGTLQIRGPGSQVIIGSGYAFANSDNSAYNWRRTGVTYVSGTPASVANWSQYTAGTTGISNWVMCKWSVN